MEFLLKRNTMSCENQIFEVTRKTLQKFKNGDHKYSLSLRNFKNKTGNIACPLHKISKIKTENIEFLSKIPKLRTENIEFPSKISKIRTGNIEFPVSTISTCNTPVGLDISL